MARTKQTVIEYRNYELPPECPVLVLTGENWRISPVRSERLHFHNCLEIGICHEGIGTMVFPSGMVDFSTGDVTFVDRNVPHTTYSTPDTHSLWSYIFLDPWQIFGGSWQGSSAWQSKQMPQHLFISSGTSPELIEVIAAVIREHNEGRTGMNIMIQSLCIRLLILLSRMMDELPAPEVGKSGGVSVAPALDYIRTHYHLDFPLDELAELCHLSPTHFRRLFHTQTGTTPVAFLNQTRILESCTLLRTTNMSIAEIAGQVGYASLSSFNRHFSEMMECSPRTWRKQEHVTVPARVMHYKGWMEAEK